MKKEKIILKLSKNTPTLGYIYLPSHWRVNGSVDKTISLFELMGSYNGRSLYFDFKDGELVGIEIVP